MTKEEFETDLTNGAAQGLDVSVITPISQLESYSVIFIPIAVECEECDAHPTGQPHILSVMQMFVSVDGAEIAQLVWPKAVLIPIGTKPGVEIPCPKYGVKPGIKCNYVRDRGQYDPPPHVM